MKQKALDISKVKVSRGSTSDPIEYKSIIYFGECSGYFRAVDQKTGKGIWSVKTGNVINGSAFLDEESLYFGSVDKCVYCVSLEGKMLWKVMTGGAIASTPQVYRDMVYFGSCDGNVRAMRKVDGREIWRFDAGDEVIGDMLVYEDRIYFGAMNGKVYCLDLSGNVVWEYKTDDMIVAGQPAIHEKILYVASSDQCMYALSIDNGMPIWRFWTGDVVANWMLYHEGVLYFGSRDAHLYAVDGKSGRELWKFRTEYPVMSTPVIYKDRIYFGSDNMYCLTLSGEVMAEYPVRDIIVGEALVLKDGIFFVCMDGVLRKVTFEFDLVWSIKTKNTLFAPHFGVIRPLRANSDFLEERVERDKSQNKPVLEQEVEFYELKKDAGEEYDGQRSDDAVSGVLESSYKSVSGSGSLYLNPDSEAVYLNPMDSSKEDGRDKDGKILKKFMWE